MAMHHSEDIYGTDGSVPNPTDANGSGARPQTEQATPADFGAQVGGAEQEAGKQVSNVADTFNGMINEAQQTQAEVGFLKEASDIKTKYTQYEGLQAEAMRPQFEADITAAQAKWGQGLSLFAQHGYNTNTERQLANQTSEYTNYATGQVKQANLNSNQALADTAIASTANLSTVLDPQQFGAVNGTIIHAANAIAHVRGWESLATGHDRQTGKLTFGDDPQGQATKAQYDQNTNDMLSKSYQNAVKTVADNQGASAAADWAQAHWNNMPDQAKVALNQYLAPKVKNETISGNIAAMNSQITTGFNNQLLSNVPSSPTAPLGGQNPIDTIVKNEGIGYSKDSKGEVINGINSLAFPKEFAEAKALLDTKGQDAVNAYASNFYQKNIIDKYNIGALPQATQSIVADGLVNHGGGAFGQSLIEAAKNGATPQQLIDMRRQEYNRLATNDPAQYENNLQGWNNRLDNLSPAGQMQSAPNKADFLRANTESLVNGAVNNYLKQYPDDYYGAQLQERRARSEITHQVTMEDGALKNDRDQINSAINGTQTKGVPPATYQELAAIPGMQPLLDKVHTQQGEYFGSIDTMIAKSSHRDAVTNSPNAFSTIMRTLKPDDDPDGIHSTDHLARGLGETNPAIAITRKDYNDAAPAIGMNSQIRKKLFTTMQDIANANGNVDGLGQQRAVDWYNQVMAAKKQNDGLGDKKMSDADFAASIGTKDGTAAPPMPSRMQQLANSKQQPVPTLTSKDQFDALPSGGIYMRDGQKYRKP